MFDDFLYILKVFIIALLVFGGLMYYVEDAYQKEYDAYIKLCLTQTDKNDKPIYTEKECNFRYNELKLQRR